MAQGWSVLQWEKISCKSNDCVGKEMAKGEIVKKCKVRGWVLVLCYKEVGLGLIAFLLMTGRKCVRAFL